MERVPDDDRFTLVALRTARVRLPLRDTLRWGRAGALSELAHVLVRADTAGGATGVAEAPVRPTIYGETVTGIEAAVHEHLAPALQGTDVRDARAVDAALAALPFNFAARGAVATAVQLARSDAEGRTLDDAYGGPRRRPEVSVILGLDAAERVVARAEAAFAAGVRTFKVKLTEDPAYDDAVFAALRHAFDGTDARWYADANEAFPPDDAPRRLARLAEAGVRWVEEPLPVHRLRERAALRREGVLPLIADDSAFTERDLERELEADTFDVLNVKPARTGLDAAVRMAARARDAGKGVMIGSQAASGLGTRHAAVLASRGEVDHPSELSFPLRLHRDLLDAPPPIAEGRLDLGAYLAARPTADVAGAWPQDPPHG